MRELIATHKDGKMKIRSLIESSVIVPTINDLRHKGFTSFVIKTVSNVNDEKLTERQGLQWVLQK